tara:strand:+ start:6542 stop:7141 length:600 start_codon:yes stop_codon:yes gene_type:complete
MELLIIPYLCKWYNASPDQFLPLFSADATYHSLLTNKRYFRFSDGQSWHAKPHVRQMNLYSGTIHNLIDMLPDQFRNELRLMLKDWEINVCKKTISTNIYGTRKNSYDYFSPIRRYGEIGFPTSPLTYLKSNVHLLDMVSSNTTIKEARKLLKERLNEVSDLENKIQSLAVESCLKHYLFSQIISTCEEKPNYDLHSIT